MQARAISRMNPDSPRVPKTGNGGFGGTAGLRAISEETDRLARDTEMRGRFKTPEQNPRARSRESNHLNEPWHRGSTRLPWQGKSPRVYPWREKQRSDRPPVLASLVRPQPRRADLSFPRLRCQRKRKNLQTESSCAPQSFPDGVTQLESLMRLPNRRRSSMHESTISTADRLGLGLGSVCSNV